MIQGVFRRDVSVAFPTVSWHLVLFCVENKMRSDSDKHACPAVLRSSIHLFHIGGTGNCRKIMKGRELECCVAAVGISHCKPNPEV